MRSAHPLAPVTFALHYVGRDDGPPPMAGPDRIRLHRGGGGAIWGYRLQLPNLPALRDWIEALGETGAATITPEVVTDVQTGERVRLVLLLDLARVLRLQQKLWGREEPV